MSDANLLVFGCAVSFIAAAGFYAYLRERFTDGELRDSQGLPRDEPARAEAADESVREVA